MTSLSHFTGGRGAPHPTGTLDGTSAFRRALSAIANALKDGWTPVKVVASGSTTAGVLKTILSLSGAGVVSFLAVEHGDTTSRTHRLKVTLDGVVIFDATSAATTSVSHVQCAIGSITQVAASSSSVVTFEPLAFNTSLLVEYASSLTESNGGYIGYHYYPT